MKIFEDLSLFESTRDFLDNYLPVVRNYSVNTIRAYRKSISMFFDFMANTRSTGLRGLTFADISANTVREFLLHLDRDGHCGAKTRNLRLSALKSFLAFSAMKHPTRVLPSLEGVRGVPMAKYNATACLKYAQEEAMTAILKTPDTTTRIGRRNRALLILMYDSAARVQEIANLRVVDIDLGSKPTAFLQGKGGCARRVPLQEKTATILRSYLLEFHGKSPAGDRPLFPVVREGVLKRMTEDNVRKLVTSYGKLAASKCPSVPNRVHPHMFRHSRAMHLYQHGAPLELISQWLGHKQLSTTMIYAQAGTEMKRKAIEKAMSPDSPLGKFTTKGRVTVDDDELIRRLYGLTDAKDYQELSVANNPFTAEGRAATPL
jgi:site-specific recombinase XerD